jgi:Flp pilus assembly protein TadB
MALAILLAFIAERLLFGELSPEKVTRLYVILGPTSIVMTLWYIWANKRQKRFEKQFTALTKMAGDA